jgi:hypothetical protein
MLTRKPSGFPSGLIKIICSAGLDLWAFGGLLKKGVWTDELEFAL